uniref:Uncharacterized protein n=1 Tax=Oryza meridionalis TaxID=40149 RepID=A0A0E0F7U1_9ORYZ
MWIWQRRARGGGMGVVGNDAVLHPSEEKWKEPVLEQWWRPSRCRGRSGGDRAQETATATTRCINLPVGNWSRRVAGRRRPANPSNTPTNGVAGEIQEVTGDEAMTPHIDRQRCVQ